MNVRKPVDYSELFVALDALMKKDLKQIELYYQIGALISALEEKGAAVAAAEYLQSEHPGFPGFSPRNVRRMRDFYRIYEKSPALMQKSTEIGWTQNVVIMEMCKTEQKRDWYLSAAQQFGWSKLELIDKIAEHVHEHISLDVEADPCYTQSEPKHSEESHDEDIVHLPRQHMPQPDGGVYYEGSGEKGRIIGTVRDFICGNQYGRDRKPGVSAGTSQADRARNRLFKQEGAAAYQCRLRPIRPSNRYGPAEFTQYAPYLRRQLWRKNAFADGVYRPPRRRGRPVVHPRFRCDLARC